MSIVEDVRKSTNTILAVLRAAGGRVISVSHEFSHGVTLESDVIVTRVRERMSKSAWARVRLNPPSGVLFHQAFLHKLHDTVTARDLSVFVGCVRGSARFSFNDGIVTTTFNTAVIVLDPGTPVGRLSRLRNMYPLFEVSRR